MDAINEAGPPVSGVPAGRGPRTTDRALKEACQQFEAVFLAKLLDKMRDTVPEDPLLGDSRAHDVYYSMLDWELAQQMARTQGVGLAEMLYRQLSAYLGEQSGDEAGAAPPGDE